MYEAAEAGIGAAINQIEDFKEDYRHIAIGKIVPEIRGTTRLIREAQGMISSPRSEDLLAPEETVRYMEIFRELRDAVDLLEGSRDDLNVEARRQRWRDIYSILILVFTAIAAVFAVLQFFPR